MGSAALVKFKHLGRKAYVVVCAWAQWDQKLPNDMIKKGQIEVNDWDWCVAEPYITAWSIVIFSLQKYGLEQLREGRGLALAHGLREHSLEEKTL